MIKRKINKIITVLLLLSAGMFAPDPAAVSSENDSMQKYLRYKALCNYKEALDVLEEWTVGLDDPVEIETNLFRIHEIIKYPELIDKAAGIYTNILRSETVRKTGFLRERAEIFLCGLMLRKGRADETAEKIKSLGFVREFRVTGPFAAGQNIFETSLFPFNDFDSNGNYKGREDKVVSFDARTDTMGCINMGDFYPDAENSVFYLSGRFAAFDSGMYAVSIGKSGYTDVWIDGINIFSNRKTHVFCHDQYFARVFIPGGTHYLLLRTADRKGENIISVRINPAEDAGVEEKGFTSGKIQLIRSSYLNALDILTGNPVQYKNPDFTAGCLIRMSGLDSIEDMESLNYFVRSIKNGMLVSESCYYTGMLEKDDSIKDLYFYRSAVQTNIESLIEIAKIKIRNKFFQDAFAVIESIEKMNPLSVESKILRAELFSAMGWTPEVFKNADIAKETTYPAMGRLIESDAAKAAGEYVRALPGYRKAYKEDSGNFRAARLLIECLIKAGKNEEAEDTAVKTIRFYPNNIWLRLILAEIKKNSAGPEAAIPGLLAAKKLSPDNPDVLLRLGFAYYSTGNINAGVYYLTEALAVNPDNSELRNYLLFIRNSGHTRVGSADVSNDKYFPGSGTGEYAVLENRVFRDFYLGRLKGLYEGIEALITAHPLDPRSVLYYYDLVRLADIAGHERIEKTIKTIMGLIEKEDSDQKNICLLILKLELEKLLYRFNREEAEKISEELSPVRRWTIAGPFRKYGISDIDYPFMPEISLNMNSGTGAREINSAAASGEADLSRFLYPEKGTAYAATVLKTARPVKIRIYSGDSYKLFVNGKETIRNIRHEVFRRCRILRIWNTDTAAIMIKFLNADAKFRVILTDDNDRVINPEYFSGNISYSDFEFMETMDYPFSRFAGQAGENDDSSFRLACYYNELGSTEAAEFYMKALELNRNPVTEYLYAAFLLDYADAQNPSSARRGAAIIDRLAEEHPAFIPVQHRRFRSLVEDMNFMSGIAQGYNLIKNAGDYLPLGLDITLLLSALGYDREFGEVMDLLSKGVSENITAQVYALHNENRNTGEAIRLYGRVLEEENSDASIGGLVKLYRERGNYQEAAGIIEKYDYNGIFRKALIDLLIESGKIEKASRLLLEEKVLKDDPEYDFKLGAISISEGIDPSMYWKRMFAIAPSRTGKEYLNYLESGKIDYFNGKGKDTAELIASWLSGVDKKTIQARRDMVFELYIDGGSRFYCDEIFPVKDLQKGIYRVPLSGAIIPVAARAYSRDGRFRDIYSITYMDGQAYIPVSVSGSDMDEAVHISYVIDNPVKKPEGSGFFFIPFIPVKTVNNSTATLKVTAPSKEKVNLYFNRDADTAVREIEAGTEYSVILDYPRSITGSEGIKTDENPVFSFSTIPGIKDIITWYSGLLTGVFNLEPGSFNERFNGESISSIAGKVYNYVSQNIIHEDKPLFHPSFSGDILFRKTGSAEDRVILAKSILAEAGIKSYIALCGRDDLIDNESFISPDVFTEILLYVPLDSGSGIWLDFSLADNPPGSVSERLSGRIAVIMLRDGFEIKRI